MMRAAERLFAEHGIDGPSLREIGRAAGQGNTRAVQYHFDNRDELLRASLERHLPGIDIDRRQLLKTSNVLRDYAVALVTPLVRKLDDPDNGREFLQVVAEVLNRDIRFADSVDLITASRGMLRWSVGVGELMAPETVGSPLHRRSATVRFVHNEMGRRSRQSRSKDHRLFCEQLCDLVVAMLAAPLSPETRGVLRRRSHVGRLAAPGLKPAN